MNWHSTFCFFLLEALDGPSCLIIELTTQVTTPKKQTKMVREKTKQNYKDKKKKIRHNKFDFSLSYNLWYGIDLVTHGHFP